MENNYCQPKPEMLSSAQITAVLIFGIHRDALDIWQSTVKTLKVGDALTLAHNTYFSPLNQILMNKIHIIFSFNVTFCKLNGLRMLFCVDFKCCQIIRWNARRKMDSHAFSISSSANSVTLETLFIFIHAIYN